MKAVFSSTQILLLMCLFLCSCRQKSTVESDGVAIINVENQIGKYHAIPASEYVSGLEYIPLETNDRCLMGKVNEIFVESSHIFIYGFNGSRSFCYTFGRDGKFLGEIGHYGQGPSEYTSIFNMSIDEKEQCLYLSVMGDKMLKYSWNGDFLQSIKTPQMGTHIDNLIFLRDSLFIGHICNSTGREMYNFLIFNNSGEIIKTFDNHIKFELVNGPFNVISTFSMQPYKVSQNIYLKELSNDTLYCLNEQNELIPQFYFHLGKYIYPIDLRQIISTGSNAPSKNLIAIPKINIPIVGTSDYIFFSTSPGMNIPSPKGMVRTVSAFGGGTVDIEDSSPVGIYDIAKKSTQLLDTDPVSRMTGLVNDLDGGLSFWPKYYTSDNELVDVWQAYEMKEILTEKYFAAHKINNPQAHQKLKALLTNLDWEDNPVIVIGKLKK